ncbi:hypothetical protein U14_05040 [Candidatus Moduliflexus flocculans]|uniref:Uncharacterized protein n=1 Tax=Candidatus Moduliflexus flocculans TaxID=1499966 RepID=A0A081BQT5_9BACT|nr:hypothetical protein U14_05040 [Candidatus Moduliflexus flocculans]
MSGSVASKRDSPPGRGWGESKNLCKEVKYRGIIVSICCQTSPVKSVLSISKIFPPNILTVRPVHEARLSKYHFDLQDSY